MFYHNTNMAFQITGVGASVFDLPLSFQSGIVALDKPNRLYNMISIGGTLGGAYLTSSWFGIPEDIYSRLPEDLNGLRIKIETKGIVVSSIVKTIDVTVTFFSPNGSALESFTNAVACSGASFCAIEASFTLSKVHEHNRVQMLKETFNVQDEGFLSGATSVYKHKLFKAWYQKLGSN